MIVFQGVFMGIFDKIASQLTYLQGQGEASVLFETAVGFIDFDKRSQMLPALVKINCPGFDLLIELDIEIYTAHAHFGVYRLNFLTEFFLGNHGYYLLIHQDLLVDEEHYPLFRIDTIGTIR